MATIIPAPPPDASATLRGVVNTSAQTFAGLKTFNGGIVTSEIDAIGALGIGLSTSTTSIGIGQATSITTIAYTANTYHNFSSPNIYFHREIAASAGTPLLNSMIVNIRANYWNGSASTPFDASFTNVMDSTTPTSHLSLAFGGVAKFGFDSAGLFWPATTNTGQVGFTTGRFLEGHFATTFSDTFDRDTAGTLNIGTGLTNGINLGSANINVFIGGQSTGTGSTRTVNPFYNINTTPATAGAPLVNSNFNYWQGNYWTGTTSNGYFGAIRVVVDTVTPTGYIQFALGQPSVSEVARLNSAGNLLFTGGGVGIDLTTGSQLNIGASVAGSILQGNASMTLMTLQAKTITLVSTDTANGGYPRTNTTNLYTGGAAIFGVFNAGTLKTYVDNNGSVVSPTAGANGGYILSAAGQLYAYPAAADTAGVTFSVQGGPSGAVVAAAGKPAGAAQLIGQTGPAGTAGLAAGDGGSAWVIGGPAGTNNGGGGANGGYVYIRPGAGSGAGANGSIGFLDVGSIARGYINPGGVTWLYPTDDITRTLGGSANRWLNVYTTNLNSGAAATNTTAFTITTGVADGATSIGLVYNNTTSLVTAGAKLLTVQSAGTEWMHIGVSATSNREYVFIGNTDASAIGPVTIKTQGNGIGTSITMDATANGAVGHKYSFISTDSGAGVGAGAFAIFDGTAAAYRMVIDSSGNMNLVAGVTVGNISQAGVGPAINIAGDVADGASSISVMVNAKTSLTTSGARIIEFRNANVAKAAIDLNGFMLYKGATSSIASDATTRYTAPTLLNSWANFGGIYNVAGYYKDVTGRVWIRGHVKSGSLAGTTVFTLPVGYRPGAVASWAIYLSNGTTWGLGLCQVDTSGNLVVSGLTVSGTASEAELNGSFLAEQ